MASAGLGFLGASHILLLGEGFTSVERSITMLGGGGGRSRSKKAPFNRAGARGVFLSSTLPGRLDLDG